MAYCAQADVQNALGGLQRLTQEFDWDRDGTADAAMITDCIAEADALIDSFASKRFKTPFPVVPEMIKRISARLAPLMSARRRGMLTVDQQLEWDRIAGTETGKEGWLLKLATGVVTPGTDPMPLQHGTMIVDVVETALPDDRDAAREKLKGFW